MRLFTFAEGIGYHLLIDLVGVFCMILYGCMIRKGNMYNKSHSLIVVFFYSLTAALGTGRSDWWYHRQAKAQLAELTLQLAKLKEESDTFPLEFGRQQNPGPLKKNILQNVNFYRHLD